MFGEPNLAEAAPRLDGKPRLEAKPRLDWYPSDPAWLLAAAIAAVKREVGEPTLPPLYSRPSRPLPLTELPARESELPTERHLPGRRRAGFRNWRHCSPRHPVHRHLRGQLPLRAHPPHKSLGITVTVSDDAIPTL